MLPNNGILALFLKTLEFLSCPSKRWHSGPIFHLTGILFSSFQTLEFWPYFYKLWNFCLYLPLQSLEFWPYPSNHLILALVYAHWFSGRIFLHIEFLSYRSKPENTGPIFIYIGIVTSPFQRSYFWPCSYKHWTYSYRHWNTYPILFPCKHWNSGPSFIVIGNLILSFQTLEFWPYFNAHWFSYLFMQNIGILAFFL